MASRTLSRTTLLLLAAAAVSLLIAVKPATAQSFNITGGDYGTSNEDGSVTVDGTTFFPNGTIVNSDGQSITPTTNSDGSVTAGGFTVYANGTVSGPDGTAVDSNGGVTFPGGLNISTGGVNGGVIQTPGFTVNPDGTLGVKNASPPPPKAAGSLALPAGAATGFISLLSTLLFLA